MSKQMATFQMTPFDETQSLGNEADLVRQETESLMANDAAAFGALVRSIRLLGSRLMEWIRTFRSERLITQDAN